MKLYLYTFCFLVLGIGQATGQDYMKMFKNQDYATIESLLSSDVTVKVESNDKTKGKSAGLAAIKAALTSFNPSKAESKHKGKSESKENDYLIVKLKNSNGESMRVFIHLENGKAGKEICDVKLRLL